MIFFAEDVCHCLSSKPFPLSLEIKLRPQSCPIVCPLFPHSSLNRMASRPASAEFGSQSQMPPCFTIVGPSCSLFPQPRLKRWILCRQIWWIIGHWAPILWWTQFYPLTLNLLVIFCNQTRNNLGKAGVRPWRETATHADLKKQAYKIFHLCSNSIICLALTRRNEENISLSMDNGHSSKRNSWRIIIMTELYIVPPLLTAPLWSRSVPL